MEFGLKLKMYKRKGLYGRQFIIPVGRLDLLCEDDEGNLYVIELKKDSGYDDAYRLRIIYIGLNTVRNTRTKKFME